MSGNEGDIHEYLRLSAERLKLLEQQCAALRRAIADLQDVVTLQKETIAALKDEIDTIQMNTLPPENDKDSYALVCRTELEQVFRRLNGESDE